MEAIEAASTHLGLPAFPVASLPENFGEARATSLIERGIVPLFGLECAIRAVAAAATPAGRSGWRPLACPAPSPTGCADAGDPARSQTGPALHYLDEARAKTLLREYGVNVPHFFTAATLAALKEASCSLQAPLVLKGLGFVHKSEAGAVRLGLATIDDQSAMPGATGYLVEEMISDGIAELLIGLRRTRPYGLCLTLGSGGTAAELLADTVTLIAPLTAVDIESALRRVRLWPLLDGYRGLACADVKSAVETVMQLQKLALDYPELVDIEINPLILRARGAVAVDAVIRRTQ